MTRKELIRALDSARRKPKPVLTHKLTANPGVIAKEYAECWQIERKHRAKLAPWHFDSTKEATDACLDILASFGCRGAPEVVHLPVGWGHKNAPGGYQRGKYLVVQRAMICVATVLHELAHYIVHKENLSGTHNKDFLWVLELVYDTYTD